jgi:hypothetical protein
MSLVAMQRWMHVFSTIKEKKIHLHDQINSGSTNRRLPCRRPLDPRCHQTIEEDPTNQELSHKRHIDPMAHLSVQTASNPRGHPKPPWGPTWKPAEENTPPLGPTRGRLTPQVGRTDLVAASERPPRGAPWLSPGPFLRWSCRSHKVVPALQIGESGAKKIATHLKATSHLCLLSPLLLSWLRRNFTSPWCLCVEDLG